MVMSHFFNVREVGSRYVPSSLTFSPFLPGLSTKELVEALWDEDRWDAAGVSFDDFVGRSGLAQRLLDAFPPDARREMRRFELDRERMKTRELKQSRGAFMCFSCLMCVCVCDCVAVHTFSHSGFSQGEHHQNGAARSFGTRRRSARRAAPEEPRRCGDSKKKSEERLSVWDGSCSGPWVGPGRGVGPGLVRLGHGMREWIPRDLPGPSSLYSGTVDMTL